MQQVADRLPPRTAGLYREFLLCPGCGRVFWKGGQYRRMMAFIESLGHAAPAN